ncbi:fungal specific transcription factor domain-containing protein [Phlyctema vagabunda]|uniref:Fungal specific transcription factor domain-containing protein n=1 Tax=Phlyctema vagabunda TaxID=108571 RepID=A0ABR4PLC4_9HELO
MMSPPPTDLKRAAFDGAKPPRKRKRVVISCTECHRRKQKCDRASPCSNCVTRGKEPDCHYENEAARKQQEDEDANDAVNGRIRNNPSMNGAKLESDSAAQVATLGYAKENGNNALGIFKKIEDYGGDSNFSANSISATGNTNGLREKYKSLIRQLPSKPHIEKLIQCFFHDVNNTYYSIEETMFMDQWSQWSNLSFSTLNKGPMELTPDLRFFPALLFQVLSLALQFQPPDYDPSLDSMKYAASMSFDDLASDYSESGCAIITLLGKRYTTLVTVQAGFLRTSYLKNCGMVPESWHSLSCTIRDAQEIGLHKDTTDHRPQDPVQALENLWVIQVRRRIWLLLSIWDVHMAVVLGRPTTIDLRDGWATFPIDTPIIKNRREVAPLPRTSTDPPTPLTGLLWTAELVAPLRDILTLEKEGAYPKDTSKIAKMHDQILLIGEQCPAFFRTQNPDTSWDNHPDCALWLPMSRPGFDNASAFTIMALHRPYIFTNSNSRTAALNASLDILRAQRLFFQKLDAKHYKLFTIVLNSFDAIVVIAATYILHPQDNREHIEDVLQHFDWSMERFETIAERNIMARAALGVLKVIYVRLKKAVGLNKPGTPGGSRRVPPLPTPPLNLTANLTKDSPGNYLPVPEQQQNPESNKPHSSFSDDTTASTIPASVVSIQTPTPAHSISPRDDGWDTSLGCVNFDIRTLAPLQPMHDLLYNDLTGAGLDPQLSNLDPNLNIYDQSLGTAAGMSGTGLENNWQFEGDFGSDSFWGFMNTYNP